MYDSIVSALSSFADSVVSTLNSLASTLIGPLNAANAFMVSLQEHFFTYISLAVAGILGYVFLPYIWDFLKRYQAFILFSLFAVFVFGIVNNQVAFVFYHVSVSLSLTLAPFVTASTVSTILQGCVAFLLFAVYKLARPFFSSKA